MLTTSSVRILQKSTGRNAGTKLFAASRFQTRGSSRNIFRIIPQGTVGYRLTFGKNPLLLKPGLHIKLPIIHSLIRVDMREIGAGIGDLHGCTKDNVPVLVSGTLFYKIV